MTPWRLSSSALPFRRESDESFSSSVTDLSKRSHHLQAHSFAVPSHRLNGHVTFKIPMWFWLEPTSFEWVFFLGGRCGQEKEFGFALNLEAGELLWMRIGRLSNQIAGKVTAACIMATIYVTLQSGLFQDVEHLVRNTQTWIFDLDLLTFIVSSHNKRASQLRSSFKSIQDDFQIQ